ncbi:hypothetical protein VXS06_14685 [Photobacterium toruni]|uniref:Uncharacterized protein n=1 Tax=Photobacterium toruni TaxID=1935446 RepID=A0ABU6L9M1_9GAMM|nr:hypothetical protein [Photobacterium toruni]
MFEDNDVVRLTDSKHSDLLFKVIGNCMKFDEVTQQAGLFKIIEPLNPAEFIERFSTDEIKDIDLSDLQIIVNHTDIELAITVIGCDMAAPGTSDHSVIPPIATSKHDAWPFAAIQAINED